MCSSTHTQCVACMCMHGLPATCMGHGMIGKLMLVVVLWAGSEVINCSANN